MNLAKKGALNPNSPRKTAGDRSRIRRIRRTAGKAGFGTLEVVIIIAVLLSVALIFRAALTDYARNLIQTVLGDQQVIDDLAID